MSKWTSMAKTHFLQEGVEATPKTPETRLTGVMGVVPQHLSKNECEVMGVMGVGIQRIYKNEPANDEGFLARLIAAAMKACDHYRDSDAAREQMRLDCLNTPPHLSADLLDHFAKTYGAKP